MGMTFSVIEEVYGQMKEYELKHNGSDIEVTEKNKLEFILLFADFKLNR